MGSSTGSRAGRSATTVRDDLDDADPQADACDERRDQEPFMKGELRVGNSAWRRVNADVVTQYIGIHRSSRTSVS